MFFVIKIGDPGNILLFNGFIFQKCGSIECNKDLFNPFAVLKRPVDAARAFRQIRPQRGQPFRGIETRELRTEPKATRKGRKGANPFAVLKLVEEVDAARASYQPQRGQPFRGIETI